MDLEYAKEFLADTRDGALEKARTYFGVGEDALEVCVVPETVEISGVGSRVLLIAARQRDGSGRAPAGEGSSRERERRPSRERRPERRERPEPRERRERAERSARSARRERPERSERPERPTQTRASGNEPHVAQDPSPDLGPVGRFAHDLVQRMKLPGRVKVDEIATEGEVMITLRGASIEEGAARDSRLASAISHLVYRAAQRVEDGEVSVRVEIGDGRQDSSEDDEERSKLEALARDAAEDVLQTGESTVLRPMNSKERWVVHNAISAIDGVRSESVGEGRMKRIQIEPE